MPNGGIHHCGNCRWLDGEKRCSLRNRLIENIHWTTCSNFNLLMGKSEVIGPLYAIVCEVRNGKGGYHEIPYYGRNRVDTVTGQNGDTRVAFVDEDGMNHYFDSVADYLDFYHAEKLQGAV